MSRQFTYSICMATYNGEKNINEQLDSIISQLGSDDELIISDDGSSDETVNIAKKYSKKYKNIIIVYGPKMGFSCNFGNAIKYSKKEIIVFSDQDDIWKADKLNEIDALFSSDDDCTTILHKMSTFSDGIEEDTELFPISYKKGVLRNYIKSSYWGCCMAVKKEFIDSFLPFRDYCVGHDQLVGLISEKYGKTLFLDEKLIRHRIHRNNTSHKRTVYQMIVFRKELLKDFLYAQKNYNSINQQQK